MSSAAVYVACLLAVPALVIAASFLRVDVERLRRVAVTSAAATLLMSLAIVVLPPLRALLIRTSIFSRVPGGNGDTVLMNIPPRLTSCE